MKTIAFVTYYKSPNLTPSDQLLVEPLNTKKIDVVAAAWDDKNVDWSKFDTIILRSCWNYHLKYKQFTEWLDHIEKLKVPVWNPIPIIRWNSNKKYLKDLEYKGAPIIPTVFVEKGEKYFLSDIAKRKQWTDLVIKPAIGASSYHVLSVKQNEYNKRQKEFEKLLEQSDVLIQPYVPMLKTKEISLIYFGNTFSHAVVKQSEHRGTSIHPGKTIIQQAQNILQKIRSPFLYARVDGIIVHGVFTLSELELIEPHLFFDLDLTASTRFTRTLKKL
jgi:glutathione synthase/RimK-type ligase-like ATP-grasp enzyme